MTTDTLTEAPVGTLTREFLSALRDDRARAFLARHDAQRLDNPASDYIPGSTGSLTAFIEDRVYGERMEARVELKVSSHVQSYTNSGWTSTGPSDMRPWLAGLAHVPNYPTSEMRAIRDFVLKVGDVLSLAWLQDNNNDNHREAGLHHDQCFLVVQRGKHIGRFLIGDSVGPDDTARMVRRQWDKSY